MLSPELISSKLRELPTYGEHDRPYRDRKDSNRRNRFWEANEQGGHFQIFKFEAKHMEYTPREYILDGYRMTISGTPQNRERIAAYFRKVLGEPVSVKKNGRETMEAIIWEIGPEKPRWGQKI